MSGSCSEGYFCISGSQFKDNDNFLSGETGGRCLAGNFCPAGASSLISCTAGKYCSEDYLSAVSGDCTERYYCTGGTDTERPVSNIYDFGNICPKGDYCPVGVSTSNQCPIGSYQPNKGAASRRE